MGFLIQAAVLAKAQRRKGRKWKTIVIAPLSSQRPSDCSPLEQTEVCSTAASCRNFR